MYTPIYTKQFAKDIKLAQKRGKNLGKLKTVVWTLVTGKRLAPLHQDHGLKGELIGHRECHIESDWLLIYKIEGTAIRFERTSTHSDLFRG